MNTVLNFTVRFGSVPISSRICRASLALMANIRPDILEKVLSSLFCTSLLLSIGRCAKASVNELPYVRVPLMMVSNILKCSRVCIAFKYHVYSVRRTH